MTAEIPTKPAAIPTATGAAAGLTKAEAARRLAQYGENALAEHHVSALERLAVLLGADAMGDRDRGHPLGRARTLGRSNFALALNPAIMGA